MKNFLKFLLVSLLLTFNVFANDVTMVPVTKNSPPLVKSYASGICSIGLNSLGTNCCTGFRIAKDKIMTNFHCLACVHEIFHALVKFTPPMMEPSHFLYSIPSTPQYTEIVKERLKTVGVEVDERFTIPHNDQEFMRLMNRYPELLTKINFKNTIDNTADLEASTYQIEQVLGLNLSLDYAIIQVSNLQDEKTLELNSQTLRPKQKLAIMGHPSIGPYPNKKVYDVSGDCEILNPDYRDTDVRIHVFTHHCSTAPGSSGSPIVDRLNGKVIGIHWGANNERDFRFGIEMKSILKDLESAFKIKL